LKTDNGYPKDTGVNKPWQPLRIPSAITPIGQLHPSPLPSPPFFFFGCYKIRKSLLLLRLGLEVTSTTSSLFFDFELKPPITSLPTSILVTLTRKVRMPNDIASCVSPYKSLEMRLIPFSIVPISFHSSNPQSMASCSTFDNSTSGHEQLTQTPKK